MIANYNASKFIDKNKLKILNFNFICNFSVTIATSTVTAAAESNMTADRIELPTSSVLDLRDNQLHQAAS